MQPLIHQQSTTTLANGEFAEILHIQGGPVVVLSQGGMASFKSQEAINDPLGNGCLGRDELPEHTHLVAENNSFVVHMRSGFVQLNNGLALLVTPFHATLFPSNNDALEGTNKLAQVPLNDIDLL